MDTYLTDQEVIDFKEGKAKAEVVEKVKLLTTVPFIPKPRFDEVTKERDNAKAEAATHASKLAEAEKQFKTDLQKQADAVAAEKAEREKVLAQIPTFQKQIEDLTKEKESVGADAAAYAELKKATIDEARKALGDKWMPEFESFTVVKIGKIVQDMVGKQVATVITGSRGKSVQDVPLTGREMIQQGLQQKK